MVQVARQKLGKAISTQKPRKRKPVVSLQPRSVREDHYTLLLAAGY